MRIGFAAALIAVALAPVPPAIAQAPPAAPAEFAGRFAGSALAKNRDSLYFGVAMRDLDTEIEPQSTGGFKLSWTSVNRRDDEPKRKRSQSYFFVPAGKPGLYRSEPASDPLAKGDYAWARIEGRVLTVYIVEVAADGHGALSVYERRRTAAGLDLVYRRVDGSGAVRIVSGKLAKQ